MARLRCALGMLLLACAPAGGQLRQADRSRQLAVENDLIAVCGAGPRPDYDYTDGTLEFGQEIYTSRRDAAVPIPGERPYAGWLFTLVVRLHEF